MKTQTLRPKEVGERLRLCKSKVYELVADGELRAVYLNTKSRRTMRITEEALAEFIASRAAATPNPLT